MTETVLNVSGVSKRFGGLQALSDVGINIKRGQVYGLIGPNGAGKTTFFNVLTGLYTPDTGSFELAGKIYHPTAVHEVAKAAIALIRNPELSHAELMQIIPGPDFPGGGQIITPASVLSEMYETGRGSMKVRACWKIEDMARGQWQAVVNELPPGVSSQKILEEIEELTNPKVKMGKKALTTEQLNLKALVLGALDTIRDESGRAAPVRLVFEPKSKNQDQGEFMQLLLAHTSLESSASINLVMIGGDGRPRPGCRPNRFRSVRRVSGHPAGEHDGQLHRQHRHRRRASGQVHQLAQH